jgi:hypothetical protein
VIIDVWSMNLWPDFKDMAEVVEFIKKNPQRTGMIRIILAVS